MIEHPEPPSDFDDHELALRNVVGPLFRIHLAPRAPIYFGRTSARSRFVAPAGEFGVLYCAEDEWGAFIETFGQATGVSSVTVSSLAANPMAKIALSRPLQVMDFASSGGLARVGADARLCTGDHELSRRWSLAVWRHPAQVDGIAYGCRHDPPRSQLLSSTGRRIIFSVVARTAHITGKRGAVRKDSRYLRIWLDRVNIFPYKTAPFGWSVLSREVALFLPFRCTKARQTAASGGTKRRSKIAGFYD